ncbi:MAG: ABC transporter substrate-binding protein [Microscillaceae bacterium]|nr:ABC transporter substrate-binding protein [Microscillaceae bacterium]
MKNIQSLYYLWLAFAYLLLHACQPNSSNDTPSDAKNQHSAPVKFKYAQGLSVQYFEQYKLVHLFRTTREAQDTLSFVLLKRGAQAPKNYSADQIIEIPIRGLIPLSTTFLEPLDRLGLSDHILGVENKAYITHEKILQKVNAGQIPEISTGEQLDQEKILSLNPDLMMTSGFSSAKSTETFKKLGLKTIPNLDWQENTPLGRAEWLKFIALLFDREAQANAIFEEIEKKYLQIAQLSQKTDKKPLVLIEIPFKDTWYVPGGNSYMAHLIKDAGAMYSWSQDESTGAIPLNLEAVYPTGLKADYWINTGNCQKKEDILAIDSRLGDFNSFKNDRIYNNNRRVNAQGGNDYWNSGVLNPHLVLSDLVKIFHPELLPNYEFTYYKKIEN